LQQAGTEFKPKGKQQRQNITKFPGSRIEVLKNAEYKPKANMLRKLILINIMFSPKKLK